MSTQGLFMCVLLGFAGCDFASQMPKQDAAVTSFLAERVSWKPMCFYLFDDPAINNGINIKNRVHDDLCPFDALEPDKELVTSLNTPHSFWQLGVHLAKDHHNDTKRVQLSSIGSVSAQDFFTMAAVRNASSKDGGVTFEMVLRRRTEANQSMTLFSIANEYDSCVDPGFRLDINEHQVLTFIYFLPVLEDNSEAKVEACYEQRLFSVDKSAACQLPPLLDPIERTPPVQIIVTLDPSSTRGLWKTDFYMSYTDVETMQRVDCVVHDEQHPLEARLLNSLIKGRYRLFLGNSPRNVSFPRQRKRFAPLRQFEFLGNTSYLNATERLRVLLKQKLMSIRGPRLPEAMRIFGDNSASLHLLGIDFPPLNEDTPLAYLRSKFAQFKEQHGDQIVDYLVKVVQQQARHPIVAQQAVTSGDQSGDGSTEFSRKKLFQGADSATFDLFHFVIYRRVVSEEQIASLSRKQLLPSRQFPSRKEVVHIPEDTQVLLNLTMLNGVFNDLRLELRRLPEFGQLYLFPSKIAVTFDNKDAFTHLPLEFQQSVYFRPQHDQNNDNLPLPNAVAFSRRLEPYATVSFGIAMSMAGRVVNKSMEAEIDIYVDAVNDAPQPQALELEVFVTIWAPTIMHLKGTDVDGSPRTTMLESAPTISSYVESSFTYSAEPANSTSQQFVKIIQLPQFGKLFDCNISCDALAFAARRNLEVLEPVRVYQNSTTMSNATYSTNFIYVYHGWGQNESVTSHKVDDFKYALSDGDPSVIFNVAVVKFILVGGINRPKRNYVIASFQLEEDSSQLLNLAGLDPLAAYVSAKTQFRVTTLPQFGALYQYIDFEKSVVFMKSTVPLECIGKRITATNAIVTDPFGRLIYYPQLDYFNQFNQTLNSSITQVLDVDFFEYRASNAALLKNASLLVHENSLTARFANSSIARRIEFEVVNVPDALVVLPPFQFTTNLSRNEAISTPVVFDDPDSIDLENVYQVNLETTDGTSVLEMGFSITDDDVMRDCTFERPCTLYRSTNGTSLSANSTHRSHELQFHIMTQLYDPSHIEVTGTKAALRAALSALTFRGVSLGKTDKAEFAVWVKRITSDDQAHEVLTILFSRNVDNDSVEGKNIVSSLNSQLKRYLSTALVLFVMWLVLSNTSCLSFLSCCGCSKARKKKRREFEQQQRLFQAQVAQNDFEYSALLMSLADFLLDPNMLVSRCVLEACRLSKSSPNEKDTLVLGFILRSLLPLLESERQGTRFIFQLIALEYSKEQQGSFSFQHQILLTQDSTASKALAYFCRMVGGKWILSSLKIGEDASCSGFYPDESISNAEFFLDKLSTNIKTLPAEIVILCRACVKLLLRGNCDESRTVGLTAVHIVFFNHFLGPALLFPCEFVPGVFISSGQQKTMQAIAYQIVDFTRNWGLTTAHESPPRGSNSTTISETFSLVTQKKVSCRYKYEAVLEMISHSTIISSEYDPNEVKMVVDCELMGMCLMNIHSFLDSYYPAFKRKMLEALSSTNTEQIECAIARVRRLLKALGWPLASIHDLIEIARSDLMQDSMLWSGFSIQEWQDRAHSQRHFAFTSQTTHGRQRNHSIATHSSLGGKESVILEEVNASPSQPEWPVVPLLSDPMSVLCLKAEYVGNPNTNFMYGIEFLNKRYEALRRVRGDGNCFFRGFIFALCEQLLPSKSNDTNAALRNRIQQLIQASKSDLVAIGYSDVAIDAFWETFVDYLAAMETRSHAELVQDFQTEGGESEYLVWYMRLLTAGYMKKHVDTFHPFIEGLYPGQTVAEFCSAEVEPMGKECDQPQIVALTEALQVGVKIEYLDGSAGPGENLQNYVCSPYEKKTNKSMPVIITLLYRPGHYEILYPRESRIEN
ncbi:hypothetical protein CCR75_002855 [Bremia lactucae]|uniref:ubiquitinyl hydrolase 1 n=1 Tax=Bremia lactucae TaxID=4779 RepID=A0A976FMI8_BRELC|nr:hypothetical protein CCR75_002855 [Bremia lactucae]